MVFIKSQGQNFLIRIGPSRIESGATTLGWSIIASVTERVPAEMTPLKSEMEASLRRDLLKPWFPACVDEAGGFRQDFAADWTPGSSTDRFLVFQARMTWVAATVFEAYGDAAFRGYAEHGLRFLADVLAQPDGSFLWTVDAEGRPIGNYRSQRHAYGSSFAIYALAAAARVLHSQEAVDLARRAFDWLEAHHRDSEHGGYFECVDPDGRPILETPPTGRDVDAIGTAYGLKSQNTHLHLMEAFAELHRVWPDPLLKARLGETLEILSERLYVAPGWLHAFAEPDWTPVPDAISYGHDVEATHLLLDAARELGREDDVLFHKAKALTDFALDTGWDSRSGGFYLWGTPEGATDRTKNWWVQAEGLLALALVLAETGDERYADALRSQWRWIKAYQVDHDHGGWFANVDEEGHPIGSGAKGNPWKAAYHDGRALLFAARIVGG